MNAGHLVVIDLQHVFGDPDSPWFAPRFGEVVDPIVRLVGAFGPEVTFTRFVAPAEPHGAWREYYARWPFALQPPDAPLYAVVEPFADRPTLDATTFGKWDARLAARAGDGLVLAGVSTDCCVVSTALAAADAGVAVRVVADACAAADDDGHRRALALMAGYDPLITVTTTVELLG